jgi:hypothetical protein
MGSNEFMTGGDTVLTDPAAAIPNSEYTRRLDQRLQQLAGIRILHLRLWICLIVAALAGVLIACAAFSFHLISIIWILPPSVVASSIIRSLMKNARNHSRVQRTVRFYELGLSRLRHNWQGQGFGGEQFLPQNHVYAADLDVFGRGSVFEYLCTARTGLGQAMLAKWLLNAAEWGEIAERQQAVAELRDMVDLQEDWASIGGSELEQSGISTIRDWAEAPAAVFPLFAQMLTLVLPICLMVLSILAYIGVFGHGWPWIIALPIGLEALLAALLLKKVRLTGASIGLPSFELALLAPLFERFESQSFQCPLLKSLQSRITATSQRPPRQIRILSLLVWLLDLRQSEYFALPSSLILWGMNLTILIENWRQRNKEGLGQLAGVPWPV